MLSNVYVKLVDLVSGFHLRYYNGLAVHLRHNVMRWHPNTRGFGFQADIICLLLDQGFSYKEVPVKTIERRASGSNAFGRAKEHAFGRPYLGRSGIPSPCQRCVPKTLNCADTAAREAADASFVHLQGVRHMLGDVHFTQRRLLCIGAAGIVVLWYVLLLYWFRVAISIAFIFLTVGLSWTATNAPA